jgi:UDP-N-acetylglucosamine 2-epimerase (non-hydrolysing)
MPLGISTLEKLAWSSCKLNMLKILCVVGARPNFIKVAPLLKAMTTYPDRIQPVLVDTGQHYDQEMVDYFFEDLEIPTPQVNLGVGSGSHAQQTARIMMDFEPVCLEHAPDLVMVMGDVNSTLACSLVASKLGIKIAHIEAGLRSFDRSMPEEINREVTDLLSDYLFTTCEEARLNLIHQGIPEERIFFVGNVMIDSLLSHLEKARRRPVLQRYGLVDHKYCLLTLHRPSNVDDPVIFGQLLDAFQVIQKQIKLVFPAHPRTLKSVETLQLEEKLKSMDNLLLLPPLGYLDFLALTEKAQFVLTDSGGLQEETTILGVPCLTLRENTERPITISHGTNSLVGVETNKIVAAAENIFNGQVHIGQIPPLWDGKASERVVETLLKIFRN